MLVLFFINCNMCLTVLNTLHKNRLNHFVFMFDSESKSLDTRTSTFMEVPENNFSKGSWVQFPQLHLLWLMSQLLHVHFPWEMISSSEFFCSHLTGRCSHILLTMDEMMRIVKQQGNSLFTFSTYRPISWGNAKKLIRRTNSIILKML